MISSGYTKKHRLKLVKNGLCISCGASEPRLNKKLCQECAKKATEATRKYRTNARNRGLCPDCGQQNTVVKGKSGCTKCLSKKAEYGRTHRRELAWRIYSHYSDDGTPKCECCGEREFFFLSIDHINNDGKIDRQTRGKGTRFYNTIIEDGFPIGLRVLCFNCNGGRQRNGGVCPHQIS
jgi:hypothetical protein